MFTVKFYRNELVDGVHTSDQALEESSLSFSCPAYQVYKRANGSVTVTIAKTHRYLDGDGVDVHLSHKGNNEEAGYYPYHTCYVENEAGKTIEAIKPTDENKRAGE